PKIILPHVIGRSTVSATPPAIPTTRNGRTVNATSFCVFPPGRISLSNHIAPIPTRLNVNRSFNPRKLNWDTPAGSVRNPTVVSITQNAATPPPMSTQAKILLNCPLRTGSTFVLSMSISWSVFMMASLHGLGGPGLSNPDAPILSLPILTFPIAPLLRSRLTHPALRIEWTVWLWEKAQPTVFSDPSCFRHARCRREPLVPAPRQSVRQLPTLSFGAGNPEICSGRSRIPRE